MFSAVKLTRNLMKRNLFGNEFAGHVVIFGEDNSLSRHSANHR